MKIYNFEQHLADGSTNPEWLDARAGHFTGSDFGIYMPLLKKDELCKTTQKELCKKVLENFGYRFEQFQTPEMLIGIEREPQAREAYRFIYEKDVQEVGFVDLEGMHAGCSPDGLITSDGGEVKEDGSNIKEVVEIKCPSVAEFAMYLDDDYIKSNYEIQVQFNMFITGADVCHFIVYHPDFNLIVRDIQRDEKIQSEIQAVLEKLQTKYEVLYNKLEKTKLETIA